jgi:hypothetical protein
VLALHVRQHRGAPLTHLIATTESFTGSQRFASIPKLLAVLAITQSHLILGRVEELYSLADTVDNLVKEVESDKAIQGWQLPAACKHHGRPLRPPQDPLGAASCRISVHGCN